MPDILWVGCPKCPGRFYIHYELKGRDLDLFCPWCKSWFPSREGRDLSTSFAELPANVTEGDTGPYMG